MWPFNVSISFNFLKILYQSKHLQEQLHFLLSPEQSDDDSNIMLFEIYSPELILLQITSPSQPWKVHSPWNCFNPLAARRGASLKANITHQGQQSGEREKKTLETPWHSWTTDSINSDACSILVLLVTHKYFLII